MTRRATYSDRTTRFPLQRLGGGTGGTIVVKRRSISTRQKPIGWVYVEGADIVCSLGTLESVAKLRRLAYALLRAIGDPLPDARVALLAELPRREP
jgi:hypothetical protein